MDFFFIAEVSAKEFVSALFVGCSNECVCDRHDPQSAISFFSQCIVPCLISISLNRASVDA
jgi:hypothetical protein